VGVSSSLLSSLLSSFISSSSAYPSLTVFGLPSSSTSLAFNSSSISLSLLAFLAINSV
jgi:hypothetical protein